MISLYLKDIITHIDGKLLRGNSNTVIRGAVNSPRNLANNTIYFHRSRTRFANLYLFTARKYINSVIITDDPGQFDKLDGLGIVKVPNINVAYLKFMNYYRGLFNIPIIGITGTCGKTTTKDMLKHILSSMYKVQATVKSQNGLQRNLKYLVGIDDQTDAAVFEMGVSLPGDLRHSCQCFNPQIRILLNIGVHHLTGCKTPAAYLAAKAEILEGLDPINGILILNADDENIKKINVSRFQKIVYFGLSKKCDFQAKNIKYSGKGMTFTLKYQYREYEVYVPGLGKHNVYNALAAIAAATTLGMHIKKICERLLRFKPVEEHLEYHKGRGGCSVIDDTWNNSVLSMEAALKVLKDISNSRITIALLGYMPRLGLSDYAIEQYASIGRKVVETGVDLLIVIGDEAKEIGRTALKLGMKKSNIYFSNNGTDIYEIIHPYLNENSIVLLKITHRQMLEPSFLKLKNNLLSRS